MLDKRVGERFTDPVEAGTTYHTLKVSDFDSHKPSNLLPYYVNLINTAIESSDKNPKIDGMPLAEFLLGLRQNEPELTEAEIDFLEGSLRTIQPYEHPDIVDDEPDYRQSVLARNLDNGTGRPAVEVRYLSGGQAHEAAHYPHAPVFADPPKPLRKKAVVVSPETPLPDAGVWSAEDVNRLKAWNAPNQEIIAKRKFQDEVERIMRDNRVLTRAEAEEKVRLYEAARRVSQQNSRSA